ncbi:hypothetical protein B5M09_007929 [Aphanomyces astaci]|uniref:Uncharacterized protein n=1 Tax=Aphanomyces astaci TaxID=112090 RepID=A0A3R7YY77_APHAT|nr:hypothetical protein B5M09_007929 [Aphanomyces astaci]
MTSHPPHPPHGGGGIDDDVLCLSSAGGPAAAIRPTIREPIRRVSGGCFSGPNCLVYFDSRVAIGQSKVLHTSARPVVVLPPPTSGSSSRPPLSFMTTTNNMDFNVFVDEPDNGTVSHESDDHNTLYLSRQFLPYHPSPPSYPRHRHSHATALPSTLMSTTNLTTTSTTTSTATTTTTSNYQTSNNADSTLVLRVHILDCANLCHHSSMLITTPDVHAAAAAAAGNIEQAQMWSILSVSTGLDLIDGSSLHLPPWHAHPFGSSLVRHMLELYEAAGDVSTLAAIVCAVHLSQPPPPSPSSARRLVMEAPATRTTSSGSTDSIDDDAVLSPGRSSTAKDQPNLSPLLDRSDLARYDGYKRAQADLLYRQGATNARCDLLKHLHTPSDPHVGLTLAVYCCHCGRVRQTT